jgi:4-hydroxy-2-oxoheptanedioate aldolase
MLDNPVKKKIERGEAAYGIMVAWPSPDIIEFCGHLGFEYVFIDGEHGSIGRETCEALVRACNLVGMVPIVRVPENNPTTILSYLETGALGIIVPHVNTAAEARAVVNAVKYNPIGKRGAGSTTRVANYGLTQTPSEYFRRANEELLAIALVEEITGYRNLEEILAVEGLDAVSTGPGDLAMSMGLPGQSGHPEVQKLNDEAEARIAASSKVLNVTVKDGAEARASRLRGARLIEVNVPNFLRVAGREYLSQAKV